MIESKHPHQTWSGEIFVPLVQNFIGGLAAAGLAATAVYLFASTNPEIIQKAALVSGVITSCGFTVIRFFGDDLLIIRRAYQTGQRSMVPQINRLQMQLHDANEQLEQLTGKADIASPTRNGQKMLQVCTDAESLIKWHYAGHKIARADCSRRGLGQRRWERAKEALANANVYDGEWKTDTMQAALGKLQSHYQYRTAQSTSENVLTPY